MPKSIKQIGHRITDVSLNGSPMGFKTNIDNGIYRGFNTDIYSSNGTGWMHTTSTIQGSGYIEYIITEPYWNDDVFIGLTEDSYNEVNPSTPGLHIPWGIKIQNGQLRCFENGNQVGQTNSYVEYNDKIRIERSLDYSTFQMVIDVKKNGTLIHTFRVLSIDGIVPDLYGAIALPTAKDRIQAGTLCFYSNNWMEDHDGDGIYTFYERENNQGNPFDYDTDGDGIPNFLDTDDDNDGRLTMDENPDPNGDHNPSDAWDSNNNGIPDYLDASLADVDISLNRTYIHSKSYDIKGNNVAQSITYYDKLAKPEQSQSITWENNNAMASEDQYDEYGRVELSVPSFYTNSYDIRYKENLVRSPDGSPYNLPNTTGHLYVVGTQEGSVGWYHSENNDLNERMSTSKYPIIRTDYDKHRPGAVHKITGGNQVDTDGNGLEDSWLHGFSHSMPVAQELYYAFGKDEIPSIVLEYPHYKFPDATPSQISSYNNAVNGKQINSLRAMKSVATDVDGIEVVSFTDVDGKTLASARVGLDANGNNVVVQNNVSLVSDLGYVDIHIPQVVGQNMSRVGPNNAQVQVINLRSGQTIYGGTNGANWSGFNPNTLQPGYYRIIETSDYHEQVPRHLTYINGTQIQPVFSQSVGLRYLTNYYDFALNYYDHAGRLVKTVQPQGWDKTAGLASEPQHKLISTTEYNTVGEIQQAESTDAGESKLIYRTDGQIRFSQSEYQAANVDGLGVGKPITFSYTHYDENHRVLEVGEYKDNTGLFASIYANPNDPRIQETGTTLLDDLDCEDQTHFFFDYPDNATFNNRQTAPMHLQAILTTAGIPVNEYEQTFTVGALTKIWTGPDNDMDAASWYSYDEFNRVRFVVQYIKTFGVTTIDYVYDEYGNVTNVIYQKHSADRYEHYYTYDDLHRIKDVFTRRTATDDYMRHARYKYAYDGSVERLLLGKVDNPLQGIDFTNGPNGLKFINDPSGDPNKDPGRDGTAGSLVPEDIFSFAIDFHNGDYRRSSTGLSVNNNLHNVTGEGNSQQFDGNIAAVRWITKTLDPVMPTPTTDMYVYKYDKNNWLTDAKFGRFDTNTQQFSPEDVYEVSGITYDANGNIQSLQRKSGDANNLDMDDLIYRYDNDKQNRLTHIDDLAGFNEVGIDDLKDQAPNNYIY